MIGNINSLHLDLTKLKGSQMSVAQSNSTYSYIERKVRRLTASSSQRALTSFDISEAVNRFYSNDFPYAIKIDQQRIVYKFLTIPNVDRYPVDVNTLQGFRDPVYFEGIRGNFFKNRDQLFNLYPRFPTQFQPIGGDGVTTSFTFRLFGNNQNPFPQPNFGILSTQLVIGGIDTNGDPIRIIDDGGAVVNSLGIGSNTTTGQLLFLQQNNVGNNVYINPSQGTQLTATNLVEAPTTGSSQYTTDVIGTLRSAYPTAVVVPTTLQFYINFGLGDQTLYQDNGFGVVTLISGPYTISSGTINYTNSVLNLNFTNVPAAAAVTQATFNYIASPNASLQQPAIPPLSPLPIPSPPLNLTPQYCGNVNYVTTEITINFPVAPAAGTMINVWAATYQVGRPYNLLFWNNELTIRPVPDNVYLCEVEVYQTPTQFMSVNDHPILNQWAQYIAYGAAMEILRDRQDMEGVENLKEGFMRQEGLVLERQSIEEINQPNYTLFNSTQSGYGYGIGFGSGGGF